MIPQSFVLFSSVFTTLQLQLNVIFSGRDSSGRYWPYWTHHLITSISCSVRHNVWNFDLHIASPELRPDAPSLFLTNPYGYNTLVVISLIRKHCLPLLEIKYFLLLEISLNHSVSHALSIQPGNTRACTACTSSSWGRSFVKIR